ncbi:TRAP transporter large permease [Alkalicella caledoniensis]|uniref:TRAP transporter large permease n=1 Tax=Alkalicella caledoniensis TaxID=2731377 RepID=A0A7G9W7P8_ALKCA|nr:TRAP transporter large permease [Alkalicella caledoniensis]QNO14710.1 TRAP transporter large permease [Alkalicella caledoniensis]
MVLLLMSILVIFMLLSFPLKVSLLLSPLAVVLVFMPEIDPVFLVQQMVSGVEVFVLLAVPMFIFAADIMCTGQTADRLLDFVERFIGHVRGGLGITTAAACTFFGAISGSTQATVVAIGKPMQKRLIKAGYAEKDIYSLIISSANIALLIPPSVVMIMYAVMTGVSVSDLFIAGIGPGLLILVFFAVYNFFAAKKNNIPVAPKATWAERLHAFKRAILPMGFPAIIIGGIYTGLFSPTEAAAASVLYAFILEVLIFKSVKIKDIPSIALSSGMVTSVVFVLVAAGMGFSWVISLARIPQMISASILGTDPSALWILFVVTIFYFIGCMFVDQLVVIIILAPIFIGPAIAAGIDPLHLGIIVTLQSAIGAVTPPFGCNIFTACAVFDKSYSQVVKGLAPYMIMFVIVSILMIFFPEIALFTTRFL